MRRRAFGVLATLGTVVWFSGCTTTTQGFTGPRPPADQLAVLRVWSMPAHRLTHSVMARVQTIDGNPVGRTDDVELLPGRHHLVLGAIVSNPLILTPLVGRDEMRFATPTLILTAEAGQRYRLVVGEELSKFYVAWIEDEAGRVVAGRRPEPPASAEAVR